MSQLVVFRYGHSELSKGKIESFTSRDCTRDQTRSSEQQLVHEERELILGLFCLPLGDDRRMTVQSGVRIRRGSHGAADMASAASLCPGAVFR